MKMVLNADSANERRALMYSVLQHNMCIPSIHTEMDSAHIRLANKQLARNINSQAADQGENDHVSRGITECIRDSAVTHAPWRQRVTKAKQHIEPYMDNTDKCSTADINQGLRVAHAHEIYTAVGASTRRNDNRLRQQQQHIDSIDPYKCIFAAETRPCKSQKAMYMQYPSKVARPLAAVRSAHIADKECFECFDDSSDTCKLCNEAVHSSGATFTDRKKPWLKMWHMLVDCRAEAHKDRRQSLSVLAGIVSTLQSREDAGEAAYADELMDVLREVRKQKITGRQKARHK